MSRASKFLKQYENLFKVTEEFKEGNVEQILSERDRLEINQIAAKIMLSATKLYRQEVSASQFNSLVVDTNDYWGSPVMPGFCEIKTVWFDANRPVVYVNNSQSKEVFAVSSDKDALSAVLGGKIAKDSVKPNIEVNKKPVVGFTKIDLPLVDRTVDQSKAESKSRASKLVRFVNENLKMESPYFIVSKKDEKIVDGPFVNKESAEVLYKNHYGSDKEMSVKQIKAKDKLESKISEAANTDFSSQGNKVYFEMRLNRDLAIKFLTDQKKIFGLEAQIGNPSNFIELTTDEAAEQVYKILNSEFKPADVQASLSTPEPIKGEEAQIEEK